MISPLSNASSPGSVGSKVCRALTRVTIALVGAGAAAAVVVEEGEGMLFAETLDAFEWL